MFKSARIKLTAWYLLIIMSLTLTFSTLVYIGVAENTKRALNAQRIRLERQVVEYNVYRVTPRLIPAYDPQSIIEIRQHTLVILIIVNAIILIVSGSLAYFLAGKTLAPIEEMLKKQKRFIADAAHEIKTPLTAMKADLEVTLRDKQLDLEGAKKTLEGTIEDVNRLNNFTNKLLEQGKYQNIALHEHYDEINLAHVIQNVINKLKPLAQEKQEDILVDIDSTSLRINGYRDSVEKLLTNIVENAIKYNKNGKSVEIEAYANNKNAVIKVRDYGIGIDEKNLTYIFEPFFREDNSRTKSETAGYGLGLAIANEIVKEHKGTIEVKSKVDEGTTFIIKLPLSETFQRKSIR